MSYQSKLFQEVCRLNNDGATFLAYNDAPSAGRALKASLLIMQQISRAESNGEQAMEVDTESHGCPQLEVPALCDTFYVYNRALLLDPSHFKGADESHLRASNAVILFNMALAFHLQGKARCQEERLRRAACFYGLAATIVQNSSKLAGGLVVAALNNQAQIYQELFEFEHSRRLLDHICELPEHILVEVADSFFEEGQLEDIYLNVSIVQAPTTAPSA